MTKPGKDIDKRERIVKRIARELRDGFYVNRIFQGELYERRIERRTVRKAEA